MTAAYSPNTQCRGKVQHRTKAIAKRQRDSAEQALGKRLRVYRCPHCDMFHLGTPVHKPADPAELKTSISDETRFKARRAQVIAERARERKGRTA